MLEAEEQRRQQQLRQRSKRPQRQPHGELWWYPNVGTTPLLSTSSTRTGFVSESSMNAGGSVQRWHTTPRQHHQPPRRSPAPYTPSWSPPPPPTTMTTATAMTTQQQADMQHLGQPHHPQQWQHSPRCPWLELAPPRWVSAREHTWGDAIVAMPMGELCAALRDNGRLVGPLAALAPRPTLELLARAAGLVHGVDLELGDECGDDGVEAEGRWSEQQQLLHDEQDPPSGRRRGGGDGWIVLRGPEQLRTLASASDDAMVAAFAESVTAERRASGSPGSSGSPRGEPCHLGRLLSEVEPRPRKQLIKGSRGGLPESMSRTPPRPRIQAHHRRPHRPLRRIG